MRNVPDDDPDVLSRYGRPMRSDPADDPDVFTDDEWANPRAGALIENAERRQLSGDHAGALDLLDQAIPLGGVDAAYAMGARAASLYELGRAVEARSQLELLWKYTPFSAIASHRAADAAEMGGDLKLALRWFDMALSRCADELKDADVDEDGIGAPVAMLLVGRRRVRRLLGLGSDDLDIASSPEPPAPDVAYPGELRPDVVTPGTGVRVLFWPRDQVAEAAARWPTLVQTAEVEPVVRQRELDNRRLVATQGARVVMVPITVAQLQEYADRTNSDPLDARTRTELLHEKFDQGAGIPWPPARNATCWCGSGLKYKKCCGAASLG